MNETRYYRFASGNVILRRTGDVVEKFGRDGTWHYQPHLLSYLMNGEDEPREITEEEAQAFVAGRQG